MSWLTAPALTGGPWGITRGEARAVVIRPKCNKHSHTHISFFFFSFFKWNGICAQHVCGWEICRQLWEIWVSLNFPLFAFNGFIFPWKECSAYVMINRFSYSWYNKNITRAEAENLLKREVLILLLYYVRIFPRKKSSRNKSSDI